MYTLKFDGVRTNGLHWTAIGPHGRIGPDVATQEEARDLLCLAIAEERDLCSVELICDGPVQHGPILLWTVDEALP